MGSGKKKALNLSSGVCGTVQSNYYKMGIRNFLFIKDDDGGTFRAECVLCTSRMKRRNVAVPLFWHGNVKICTTITASYHCISIANVKLKYGNHSRPAVIQVMKRSENGL